jgi:hypothetical protein
MLQLSQKTEALYKAVTFDLLAVLNMPKFQPMGKVGIDDESDYDNELDADFDDGSDGNKKLP